MGNKILFVSGGMGCGGAERVISILANHYAEQGWKVGIVLMFCSEVAYPLNEKINIFDMTVEGKSRIGTLPHWLKGIRKTVKTFNPDVVVSFVARVNIITLISLFGLHKKIIISERNDPYCDGRGFLTVAGTKILYPYAFKLVLQTRRSQNYFSEKIRKNSVIIPNPVQVYEYAGSIKKKKIVSVGRLAKQKNHKLLIRAFGQISKQFPDYELWIYGEGEMRGELESLLKRKGIADKVFLPGIVKDVHHQIADALVFVLSSDYEGLSNAFLEAIIMGLPCISTNCAGADEVIQNGKNGIIVPVGDKDGLARAIAGILGDSKKREEMGRMAHYSGKKYSVDKVLKKWDRIIKVD